MNYFVFMISFLFTMSSAFAQCVNPGGERGQVVFNETYDVLQGCTARGWMAFHEPAPPPPDPCAGTPSPGDVCADGSVYAGLSPHGNVAMYTTPADAGQFSWNDGATNWLDIPTMMNCFATWHQVCNRGEANTSLLAALGTSPSPAPYVAARHCDNLTAHGHSDWYLPALYELNVLYTNRTALGGFNLSGSFPAGWYWSSSERNDFTSWAQNFSDASQDGSDKAVSLSVRCVRR